MTSKVSTYFDYYHYQPTKQLIEDLIIQQIQMTGTDVIYIKKDIGKLVYDTYLNEADFLKYETSGTSIECYVLEANNINGFGNMISFFGLELGEALTLTLSKRRFKEEFKDITRPIESDLIYLPLNHTLYEIVSVNEDSEFLKHGRNYCWTIKLNVYSPSSSEIDYTPDQTLFGDADNAMNNDIQEPLYTPIIQKSSNDLDDIDIEGKL